MATATETQAAPELTGLDADGLRVHFLDVGEQEYGDAVLLDLAGTRVLIDGAHPGDQVGSPGHPSIPAQLASLLDDETVPLRLDLLVVTHAHQDHIGCLPFLVKNGLLTADWALVADPALGWGRPLDDSPPPPSDGRVMSLVAALREEVRTENTDSRSMERFLVDAVTLEQQYNEMLDSLEEQGCKLVRHGRDDPAELVEAFASSGLEILGPSQEQLLACAEVIALRTDAAESFVSDRLGHLDRERSEVELYRSLVNPASDAISDAVSRPGPAINLQSIVVKFERSDAKLLFAGDMQFADPQVASEVVDEELDLLRQRIEEHAPYSLVKLSHHGSDNAFDQSVLAELGDTRLYGICAGAESLAHPNRHVLSLLEAERERLEWMRTDRNGQVTVEFNGDAEVSLTRGEMSDPRPNAPDQRLETSPAPTTRSIVEEGVPVEIRGESSGRSEPVEIVTKIPPGVDRLELTVELNPTRVSTRARKPSDQVTALSLAAGRQLPPLLFVTSRERLTANVGEREAEQALQLIDQAGQELFDQIPSDATDPTRALAAVGERLRGGDHYQGVVIVGGYDVVPAQRLDALPPSLRGAVGGTDDPDDFVVWSDDAYGDTDGDLIAELPVSRIPDGRSPELLFVALGVEGLAGRSGRAGVRNIARPFAEGIFAALPGSETLAVSMPAAPGAAPPLDRTHVYLMLHGDYIDSSRFWGEDESGRAYEAINMSNLAASGGGVVFTGCCWGALTVDQPAIHALPGAAPPPKVADGSLALAFLQRGATAFLGCTGAHYSPTEEPYGYFGGPMHASFWAHLESGSGPAEALFAAKVDYVRDFPHGRTSEMQQAIEYKILRQYTCLGLGW